MECPICYCSQADCKLACKHTFCHDCVKNWYIKCPNGSTPSCPMCRRPIYFKGFHRKVEEWEEDYRECIFQTFFEDKLEEIMEEINPLSMAFLKYISLRLEKIRTFDCVYDGDDIEFFMYHDMSYQKIMICDDNPWLRLSLSVSKHPHQPRKKSKQPFYRGFKDYPCDTFLIMYI